MSESGKVLRFYGQWDDTASLHGAKTNFRIMYYLSDDTISVSEDYVANSGKDHFPDLIKRIRLSRKPIQHDTRARGVDDEASTDDYYNADDLRVGSVFNVLGREVLLFDCDPYTQAWYAENRGVDQKAGVVDVSEPVVVRVKPEPPPPTWFGSEEDSMASVKHLVPKVPKVNWEKVTKMSDKLLRFSATLESVKPVDVGRQFVVTWCVCSRCTRAAPPAPDSLAAVGTSPTTQWPCTSRRSATRASWVGRGRSGRSQTTRRPASASSRATSMSARGCPYPRQCLSSRAATSTRTRRWRGTRPCGPWRTSTSCSRRCARSSGCGRAATAALVQVCVCVGGGG